MTMTTLSKEPPRGLLLVRDVLDKQLLDRTGRECGKVDGLILVTSSGEPPAVAFIECGAPTLARRIGRRAAKLVTWIARKIGPRRGEVVRIPWDAVEKIDVAVELSFTAEDTPIDAGETWSRERVIAHIPGGS
jgi:hypothetical protein